jgi:hypothetical protein
MVGKKWCNDCKDFVEKVGFYKNRNSPDGLDYYCVGCRKKRKSARKEEDKSYFADYRKNNVSRRQEYSKQFNKQNKEYFSNWRDLNRGKTRAYVKKYYSRKSKATPPWLTKEDHLLIESFYIHARDCEVVSGQKYHVDHIVPLQGENVCGLHVPWNLQVLPCDLNISKSNKF